MSTQSIREEMLSLLGKTDFNRRTFVVTSLAAGFALAVQPVSAETITTDDKGLEAGEVKIPVADGEMPAYRAMPAKGGPFPVVLVVQEIFGVHEHIKDICRRFAKLGYLAIAPELYARQGDVSKIDELPRDHHQGRLEGARRAGHVRPRRDGGVGQEDGQGGHGQARHHRLLLGRPDRLAVLGPQQGPEGGRGLVRPAGRPARRAASQEPDRPGRNAERAGARPLRRRRQGIPVESVEKMQKALKDADKPSEIVLYPDTPHGFHADYRPSYRKDKAEDGWKRLLEWFKKNGVA